jgi:putative peptidoglycan lipid II flippase
VSAAKGTLRSSASVSAAVLASRVLGVARDALFAAAFGVSSLTDAYVVAFRIPNLLRDLFAEGALSSAFVPTFTDALANGGRERAYRLGNLVVSALLVVTGALTVAGIIYAAPVVSLLARDFGGDQVKLAQAALLARVMMPILLLVSVSAAWMGMLNAQQRYGAPALAPALFNVTSIVFGVVVLALGHRLDERQALLLWSGGTTVAGLVQGLVQLPSLWRLGYRPRLSLAGVLRDRDLRRIVRLMGPATLGLAAIQFNVFVNTQFAAALGDGPLTYLNNAFRLFYLPIGLFGVALATVTTARASADAARGDRAALIERVEEGARGVWLLALPSAVGLIVLAEPVVALLFQRGRFVAADTAATVPVVQAYMLGVLPYSLTKVLSPAFFTIDRPRIPMVASMCAVAANVTFNALTYRRLGAPGLALGTTIAALVNLFILRVASRRVIGRSVSSGGGERLSVVVASVALGLVAVAGKWLSTPALAAVAGHTPRVVGAARGLLLLAIITVSFVVYVIVLRLLGHPAARELWRLPARVAGRLRARAPSAK